MTILFQLRSRLWRSLVNSDFAPSDDLVVVTPYEVSKKPRRSWAEADGTPNPTRSVTVQTVFRTKP